MLKFLASSLMLTESSPFTIKVIGGREGYKTPCAARAERERERDPHGIWDALTSPSPGKDISSRREQRTGGAVNPLRLQAGGKAADRLFQGPGRTHFCGRGEQVPPTRARPGGGPAATPRTEAGRVAAAPPPSCGTPRPREREAEAPTPTHAEGGRGATASPPLLAEGSEGPGAEVGPGGGADLTLPLRRGRPRNTPPARVRRVGAAARGAGRSAAAAPAQPAPAGPPTLKGARAPRGRRPRVAPARAGSRLPSPLLHRSPPTPPTRSRPRTPH